MQLGLSKQFPNRFLFRRRADDFAGQVAGDSELADVEQRVHTVARSRS